jgi:hypothetical protein
MGEVEIVEMRAITAGFLKRRMKSMSLSLPSPLILYLLISHERRHQHEYCFSCKNVVTSEDVAEGGLMHIQ